ncbi:MAG: tetratricopeptide repeat protein [Bacteroidota bacterium]
MGVVLLVLMAAFWSVDASIVRILFGGAAFFIFLGWWSRQKSSRRADHSRFGRQEKRRDSRSGDFIDDLKELFKQKGSQQTRVYSGSSSQASNMKVIKMVLFFISSVFFIIIFSVVFLSIDETADSETIYYAKAEEFRWAGQNDSAAYYYRRALSLKPDYVEAMVGHGYVMLAAENYDSAMARFDQALVVNPDYDYAAYSRALVSYYKKDYDKSLAESVRLFEKSPGYYDATLLAGDNYYAQNRYDSAIRWYEVGYAAGLRSQALCHIMAYIYDQQSQTDRAIELYVEALGYDSTKIEIYQRLGQLLPGEEGNYYRQMANQLNGTQ